MTSFTQQTALDKNHAVLSVDQKETLVRNRAEELINNASLALVEERMPQYVELVEEMIGELNYKNPVSVATAGSWAMEGQANAGREVMQMLGQEAPREALLAADRFSRELNAAINPIQRNIELRTATSGAARAAIKAGRALGLPKLGKKLAGSLDKLLASDDNGDLDKAMEELRASDETMAGLIEKTQRDANQVVRLLSESRHIPAILQDGIIKSVESHTETAEGLYLTLVAVTEYENTLRKDIIPVLEQDVWNSVGSIGHEEDDLKAAKKAVGLLERRRTDVTVAILNSCVQREMALEMGNIAAGSAMEMERIQHVVVNHLVTALGNLCVSQAQLGLAAFAKASNQMMTRAISATTEGYRLVVERTKENDEEQIKAANAVIEASQETIAIIRDVRAHERKQLGEQEKVREKLAAAVGALSCAAHEFAMEDRGVPSLSSRMTSVTPVVSIETPVRSGSMGKDLRAKFKQLKKDGGPR